MKTSMANSNLNDESKRMAQGVGIKEDNLAIKPKIEPKLPVIYWTSTPVAPGNVVMVYGGRLANVDSIEIVRLPDSQQPAPPPVILKPIQITDNSVKFEIPSNMNQGVFEIKIKTPIGMSKPVLLNQPDIWWCQGDIGLDKASGAIWNPKATPGGWIRIFGRCLGWTNGPTTKVLLKGKILTKEIVAQADCYAARIKLPDDLPTGEYEVSVNNGFGDIHGWSNPFKITVTFDKSLPDQLLEAKEYRTFTDSAGNKITMLVPENFFDVKEDFGAKGNGIDDDTKFIQNAINEAKKKGKGVIYFPRGTYRLSDTLYTYKKLLFSIDPNSESSLNSSEGTIPKGTKLWNEFNSKGISLSQDAIVKIENPNNKWLIVHNNQQSTYTILKEESKLNVYDNIVPDIPPKIVMKGERADLAKDECTDLVHLFWDNPPLLSLPGEDKVSSNKDYNERFYFEGFIDDLSRDSQIEHDFENDKIPQDIKELKNLWNKETKIQKFTDLFNLSKAYLGEIKRIRDGKFTLLFSISTADNTFECELNCLHGKEIDQNTKLWKEFNSNEISIPKEYKVYKVDTVDTVDKKPTYGWSIVYNNQLMYAIRKGGKNPQGGSNFYVYGFNEKKWTTESGFINYVLDTGIINNFTFIKSYVDLVIDPQSPPKIKLFTMDSKFDIDLNNASTLYSPDLRDQLVKGGISSLDIPITAPSKWDKTSANVINTWDITDGNHKYFVMREKENGVDVLNVYPGNRIHLELYRLKQLDAVIRATNNFGIQDLTITFAGANNGIIADIPRKGIVDMDSSSRWYMPNQPKLQNENSDAGNIFLHRVRIRWLLYSGYQQISKPKINQPNQILDNMVSSSGTGSKGVLLAFGGKNIEICDCDLYCSGQLFNLVEAGGAIIARNRFSIGRCGYANFDGCDGVICEDNTFYGADNMTLHGVTFWSTLPVRNVYFARNTLNNIYFHDGLCAYNDGGSDSPFRYIGKIGSADKDSLTFPKVIKPSEKLTKKDDLICFVLSGPGKGQVRYVDYCKQSNDGSGNIILGVPKWDINPIILDPKVPKKDVIVAIDRPVMHFLVIGNVFEDVGESLRFSGMSVDCIAAENRCIRAGGLLSLAGYENQPTLFVQYLNNEIYGKSLEPSNHTYKLTNSRIAVVGQREPKWPEGCDCPIGLGFVIRGNRLESNAKITLNALNGLSDKYKEPFIEDVIIEKNDITHTDTGIEITKGCKWIILHENSFTDVDKIEEIDKDLKPPEIYWLK